MTFLGWIDKWKKTVWWFFLLILFSTYLFQNRIRIFNNTLTQIDFIIFILWIVLLIFPLFSEIDIAGIKLKKEIESLKSEIKEQIFTIRSEIRNSATFQNIYYPIIPQPPSPEKIQDDKLKYSAIFKSVTPSIAQLSIDELTKIPEKNKTLFSIRLTLENELRRIVTKHFDLDETRRPISITQMVRMLVKNDLLDPDFLGLVTEINIICSRAVHQYDITDDQYEFVLEFYPKLLQILKAM